MSKRVPRLVNVLRDVNALRHRLGFKTELKKLPKGVPNKLEYCVIAKATGTFVDGWYARTGDNEFKLTKRLQTFVDRFDDGKYPWLIAT